MNNTTSLTKMHHEMVALRERAEKAEAELQKLREQKPVAWVDYIEHGDGSVTHNYAKEPGATYARPLYADPVAAPAVPVIEGPAFTVADDDELNALLNLSANIARGEANQDSATLWNQTLESVLARLKAVPIGLNDLLYGCFIDDDHRYNERAAAYNDGVQAAITVVEKAIESAPQATAISVRLINALREMKARAYKQLDHGKGRAIFIDSNIAIDIADALLQSAEGRSSQAQNGGGE